MNDTLFNRVRKSLEPSAQACIPACPPGCLWLRPSPSTRTIIPFRSMPWIPALCNVHTFPESAPHPARLPFSEQQTATPVSNSGFKIFSSKAPAPTHSAHPGWVNFSSVSALVAPMLPSIRPLITGHTSLLNSDSPMMRRTVIYVSLEPKCLTENRHRIATGWMGEYMNRRMDARMNGWIKRDSWEPPGIQRVKEMYN